jgi:hypothetical protein
MNDTVTMTSVPSTSFLWGAINRHHTTPDSDDRLKLACGRFGSKRITSPAQEQDRKAALRTESRICMEQIMSPNGMQRTPEATDWGAYFRTRLRVGSQCKRLGAYIPLDNIQSRATRDFSEAGLTEKDSEWRQHSVTQGRVTLDS